MPKKNISEGETKADPTTSIRKYLDMLSDEKEDIDIMGYNLFDVDRELLLNQIKSNYKDKSILFAIIKLALATMENLKDKLSKELSTGSKSYNTFTEEIDMFRNTVEKVQTLIIDNPKNELFLLLMNKKWNLDELYGLIKGMKE